MADDLTFADFHSWTVENLKNYNRARGLKVTGNKNDLAARAFTAYEIDLPLVPDAEEHERQRRTTYEEICGGTKLPGKYRDPRKICDGWIKEENGVLYWPKITEEKMISYFDPDGNSAVLVDYKRFKAYQHYVAGWVKEVEYFNVEEHSTCLLKNKCLPSQKISNEFHEVWVAVDKNEGTILCAHCTCAAGLSQRCNHVAGLLFRVEEAVQRLDEEEETGNQAPTSRLCQWIVPSKAVHVQCDVIENLLADWQKKKYKKKPTSKKVLSMKRLKYTPTRKSMKRLTRAKLMKSGGRHLLSSALKYGISEIRKEMAPPHSHSTAMDANTDTNNNQSVTIDMDDTPVTSEAYQLPPTMFEVTATFKQQCTFAGVDADPNRFMGVLPGYFTDQNYEDLEMATREQNATTVWHDHRRGRITASSFGRVAGRQKMASKPNLTADQKRKSDEASVNLTSVLVNPPSLDCIPAIRYGRENEPIARQKYCDVFMDKHANLSVESVGLCIFKDCPILAASPDGLVTCDCCPPRLLEIKCPKVLENVEPVTTSEKSNISFIEWNTNKQCAVLKPNHAYHAQIQGQLCAKDLDRCDLFVWSKHGYVCIEVERDLEYWDSLQELLLNFAKTYLLPFLLKMDTTVRNITVDTCGVCQTPVVFCIPLKCSKCDKGFHKQCISSSDSPDNWICCACETELACQFIT